MKTSIFPLAVCLFLSTAVAGSLTVAKAAENDATAIQTAKISLGEAVLAAEHSVDGKASKAELERYHDRWVYDVEVVTVKSGDVLDVKVNPANGSIINTTKDAIDRDDNSDRED